MAKRKNKYSHFNPDEHEDLEEIKELLGKKREKRDGDKNGLVQ